MSTKPNSNATSTSDRQIYPSSGASSTRYIMPSERHTNNHNPPAKCQTQLAYSSYDNVTTQQHGSSHFVGHRLRQSFIDNVPSQTTINLALNRGSRRGSSRVKDNIDNVSNVAQLTTSLSVPSVMLQKAESDSNLSNISAARSAPPPVGSRSERSNSSFCIRQRRNSHHQYPVDFERGYLKISAPMVEEIIKYRRTFILLILALLYTLYGLISALLLRPSLSHTSPSSNNGSIEEWSQEMIAGWHRDRALKLAPELELSSGNKNDTIGRHVRVRVRECQSRAHNNLMQQQNELQQLLKGNDLQEHHDLEMEVRTRREQLHKQEHLLERHQLFKQHHHHQVSSTLKPVLSSESNSKGNKSLSNELHLSIGPSFPKKRRKFEALNGCFFRRDGSSESLGDLCCCSGIPRYVLLEVPLETSNELRVSNKTVSPSEIRGESSSTKRPGNGTIIHLDTPTNYLNNFHINLSKILHSSKEKSNSVTASSSLEVPNNLKQLAVGMNSTGKSEKLAQQTSIISTVNENNNKNDNKSSSGSNLNLNLNLNNKNNNKAQKLFKRKYLRPQIMCFVSAAANIFNSQKLVAPIANEINLRNTFVKDKGKCITCSCCHEHDPEKVNKLLANVPLYTTKSKSMMLDKNGNQLIKPSTSEDHEERSSGLWVKLRNHLSALMQHLDDFFFWLYDVLDYSILTMRYGIYPIQNFTDSNSFILIQSAFMRPDSFNLPQTSSILSSLKPSKTTEQPSLYIDDDSYNHFTTTTTTTTVRPRHLSTRRGIKSAAERHKLRARRRRLKHKKLNHGKKITTTKSPPRESTKASRETTSTLVPESKVFNLLSIQGTKLIKSLPSSSTTKTPTVIINVYAGNNNTPLDRSLTTITTKTPTKSPSSSSATKELPKTKVIGSKPLEVSSIGERLNTSKSVVGNFEFHVKLDSSSTALPTALLSSPPVPAANSSEPTIKTMTKAPNESLEMLTSSRAGNVAQIGASKSAAPQLPETRSVGAIRRTINLANDTLFAFQTGNSVVRQPYLDSSEPVSLDSERYQQEQLPLQQAGPQIVHLNSDNFQNASSTSSKPAVVISLGASNSSSIIANISATELDQHLSQIHSKGFTATSTILASAEPMAKNNLDSKNGLLGEVGLESGSSLESKVLLSASLPQQPRTLKPIPVDLNIASLPALTANDAATTSETVKRQKLGSSSITEGFSRHKRSSAGG